MTFEFCLKQVGIAEGGLSMKRSDRGNWTSGIVGVGQLKGTKGGVSAMSYPHLDIANLTKQQISDIFFNDFWKKFRIGEMAPYLRLCMLDSVINHGADGVKLLQRAAGILQDGKVGPITLTHSYKVSPLSFCLTRGDHYVELTQNGFNDANDRKQLKGWIRRNTKTLYETLLWQHNELLTTSGRL